MTESPDAPVFVRPGASPEEIAEVSEGGVRPVLLVASAPRRIAGRLLDLLVLVAAWGVTVITVMLAPSVPAHQITGGGPIAVLTVVIVVIAGSSVFLRIILVAWWGCTAGQRIVGLRVVHHPGGTPARGWSTAWRRWLNIRSLHSDPVDDLWTMLEDRDLRRCGHDVRAGTVVVRAQAPLLPGTWPPVPDRSWVIAERLRRAGLVTLLGLAGLALVAVATVPAVQRQIEELQRPPFALATFYDERTEFSVRSPTGRSGGFRRTAGRVLDDEAGCQAGGAGDQERRLLRRLGCLGRIETAFVTSDGVVQASGHLLRFADAGAARAAAGRLSWTDLRFVPGGPADPPGKVRGGLVDHNDRYVLVTSVLAPKGTPQEEAKNALVLLHAPTLNVIEFM
ncbi:RDD family protein [Nonomuraea sp. B1E8]|uniref:RDD family protein n=1 Tax=unclassified Nonomuraea TaxID=2593643 RepID=UPI00325CE61F